MEENCNIVDIDAIRSIYDRYIEKVNGEFGVLFSKNHLTDLAVKNEAINLIILAMVRFEQLFFVHELCLLDDKDYYQQYMHLQSINYNQEDENSERERVGLNDNLIFDKFKSNYSFGYGGYYLYLARPDVIITGILKDLKHFEWSNSTDKDYLMHQNIITQNYFVLFKEELPELQEIFVTNWDNYVEHNKIAFILNSAKNIKNEKLVKKLLFYLLYQKDQDISCPTSYCMRRLFLNSIDRRDYMEEILLEESRKRLYNSTNPALPYLEMFYSIDVYNFFTNSLADKGVSVERKKKIASMLRWQYESLLNFKKSNSDRSFFIKSIN